MSFFSFLGLGRRTQSPLSRSPAQRMYIVDATGLLERRMRNGNGQPSPRDHFLVLKNLAQFAGRERISLAVVFIGRPLREAGEGGQYKGVTVHYAERADARSAKLLHLVRGYIRSRDVVLITGNAELEREARALNAACMRPSTLRKAMDDRDERDNERSPRYGRSRPPMDRRQERQPEPTRRSEPERQPEAVQRPPAKDNAPAPAPAEHDKPEPGVLDLIDPV